MGTLSRSGQKRTMAEKDQIVLNQTTAKSRCLDPVIRGAVRRGLSRPARGDDHAPASCPTPPRDRLANAEVYNRTTASRQVAAAVSHDDVKSIHPSNAAITPGGANDRYPTPTTPDVCLNDHCKHPRHPTVNTT